MRRIGTEEIDLTPGANRDISKVVQSAPGVLSVPTANRNDVLVRGGGANENRYYLDGIEIPVLNHFAVRAVRAAMHRWSIQSCSNPSTFIRGLSRPSFRTGSVR